MVRIVIWSRRAIEDLEEIATYISRDSEHYAKAVLRTILAKIRRLGDHPFIGRVVPEFSDDALREIFAYSYRIIYSVKENEILIAAVVHGKRSLDLALRP